MPAPVAVNTVPGVLFAAPIAVKSVFPVAVIVYSVLVTKLPAVTSTVPSCHLNWMPRSLLSSTDKATLPPRVKIGSKSTVVDVFCVVVVPATIKLPETVRLPEVSTST